MVYESAIRAGTFIAILVIMGTAETLWPRRVLQAPKLKRWLSNISVAVVSTGIVRLFLPLIPTSLALYCSDNGIGILNVFSIPTELSILLSVLLMDMIIYWQHVAFHRHPLLWKIHRMHHADVDIDASTGIRFHPIEIVMSIFIKLIAIVILGPPAIAVLIFEVLLNGCALFNHANVEIPLNIDAKLRLLMVTPDMHRVHHSTNMREANMNFGFNFPWWDRLFGSYKNQPADGHIGMTIGMNIFRDPKFLKLPQMLMIPFR